MNFYFFQIFFLLLLFQFELNEIINPNKENLTKKEEKSEIINLNDTNFNSFVKDVKDKRWIILFYIESCHYCDKALNELEKILRKNKFKVINDIKFGIVDISNNQYINFRFNISQVPYIILVENNSIVELNLYPNEKNLIDFIESNLSNFENILPLPKKDILKYYYTYINNSLSLFIDPINQFLKSNNINYSFNSISFILLYTILCIILWTIIIKAYNKCSVHKKKRDLINFINKNGNDKNDLKNKDKKIINDDKNDNELNKKNYNLKRKKHKKN